MAISEQRRQELIGEYRRHEGDTGSPEVQVAILTEQIRDLTEHLKEHRHDYSSRRGLLQMVSKRSRLTRYLQQVDRGRYIDLIGRLGLRK
jgi:small subunit ribosomal protein S15